MPKKPLVFVGSSAEGLKYAKAIQLELRYVAECVLWSQGGFGLSEGPLESLVKNLGKYDFAILVLTPDDLTESRGASQPSPRDNVLLELGLFIGYLGRERTFMVVDQAAKLKLPSDLVGIEPAYFEPPGGGTAQSAVGAACTRIEERIVELKSRERGPDIEISAGWVMDAEGSNLAIYIGNNGDEEILPFNVSILDPVTRCSLDIFKGPAPKKLHRHQRRQFKLLHQLLEGMPGGMSEAVLESESHLFRLTLDESDHVIYESEKIGKAIIEIIRKLLNEGIDGVTGQDLYEVRNEGEST